MSLKVIKISLSGLLCAQLALLFTVFIASCAFKYKADEATNLNLKPLAASPNTFHTMNDFIGIMNRSRVEFKAMKSAVPLANDITGGIKKGFSLNPYFIVRQAGTIRSLYTKEPKDALKREWKRAERLAEEGKNSPAKASITQALRIDPSYFKNYTVAGRVFLKIGEIEDAIQTLLYAVKLNDIDFEAHVLLARAYMKLEKIDEALASYAYAFMLNKHDEKLRKEITTALVPLDMVIRPDRFVFPFKFEEVSPKSVKIWLQAGKEKYAAPITACLSCWLYDPDYPLSVLRDNKDPLKLIMYKECIMSQALAMDALIKTDHRAKMPEYLSYLNNAVWDKTINAIILWEFAASADPYCVLLTSDIQKKEMQYYISKYVFVKQE